MTTVHALFPSIAAGQAAADQLIQAGLAEDGPRRPEVFEDRLYHTPHPGQSAIPAWFLGGATLGGIAAGLVGALLAEGGTLGVPVPTAAAAMLFFFMGGALGGLSAALGGSGAFRSDYYAASSGLEEGRALVTVHVPWTRTDDTEALLDAAGAIEVTLIAS